MPAVQTTYNQYQTQWPGAGFEPHMVGYNNVTRLCKTAGGIPFGRAVSQDTGYKNAILGGTKFLGISVMDQFRVPTVANPTMDKYLLGENLAIKTLGPIVVVNNSGQAVAPHDAVFYDPTTGTFANVAGAISVAAPTFTGTGNGVLTRSTPQYSGDPLAGEWNIRFVQAAANAGRFIVVNPEFEQVGEGNVAVEFNQPGAPRFTIADGSTDFIVGDLFKLVVSKAAEGPILGARWETAAADAALAIVHLGIQK